MPKGDTVLPSLVAFAAAASQAVAQVPDTVTYQGRLLDAAGGPISGTRTLAFTLFDAPTGGTPSWTETHPSVVLSDGAFSVVLTARNASGSLFEAGPRWLEIAVDGVPLAPRTPMTAVPFAQAAAVADTLAGGTGTGSGLDADLLDGQHASAFASASVETAVANADLPYAKESTLGHIGAAAMCAGLLGSWGYGQMQVVRSNGVSCDSACNALDTFSGPYTDYYCYGSVSLDAVATTPQAANQSVARGWFGRDYCAGTNGMSVFCCCKANYPNTK